MTPIHGDRLNHQNAHLVHEESHHRPAYQQTEKSRITESLQEEVAYTKATYGEKMTEEEMLLKSMKIGFVSHELRRAKSICITLRYRRNLYRQLRALHLNLYFEGPKTRQTPAARSLNPHACDSRRRTRWGH